MIFRIASAALVSMIIATAFETRASAAENYQTDIGPTPLNGLNRADITGRGAVLASLTGNRFSLHGTFGGLTAPATEAHLCMGNVMGGTGPAIFDVAVSQAQSGELSATLSLNAGQIAALKAGKLYILLDSRKAPKGNLWGWFQPAHKTVGPDVPQQGKWYLPNILNDDGRGIKKKIEG